MLKPSSGMPFHSLQATSQALQPMQIEVSVKNPTRGGDSSQPASRAGPAGSRGAEREAGRPAGLAGIDGHAVPSRTPSLRAPPLGPLAGLRSWLPVSSVMPARRR